MALESFGLERERPSLMFGSTILDVVIGLVFIYLLPSLIATALREGLEAWMKSMESRA